MLTHHDIIDRITEQIKCAKNQNCGSIRTYAGEVSHLLIHLSSLTFLLDIYIYIYLSHLDNVFIT